MPSVRSLPTANLYLSTSPIATHGHPTVASHASSQSSAIPASLPEENNQDSAEVGFFLRHFAEHGGQWMDICTGQRSYFSQYVVQLASQSPILRYSACAFAAKQMGQMKDSTRATNITTRSSMTASMLLRASLDFLWYGAKYYEKAILLMARQISHDRSTVQNHLSPGEIYRSPGSDYHHLDYHESTSSAFRILAACILCSYEDLSGTMRAWTGHLDGINKLFRPHLDLPISPDNFYRIPQSMRALNVSFWYFALNDMLNGFTLSQPCRINPDDHPLWRKMGLPLSDSGQLMSEYIEEEQQESIFFKALIRLLCKLVNLDKFNNPRQWTLVDTEFTQWRNALPPEFFAPITHNLPPTQPPTQEPPAETWLSSETCAVAMAFYHMARIVLIINQPQEIFITAQKKPGDLLSTYKVLHENLTHHANEILPIAHGMPNITVQKYLVQPLYVSARCFLGWNERITVIELLRNIQASLGLATEYRVKDLAEEWKIDYESISLPEHGVNVVP
ncbi:hypothetical protein N7532_001183 [Penicillium argentinense]|uniref:Uncharacterized protein n=1 Tax=Penicillium argentinense TaxID=1131581 RepID=A0A9W9G231_9EURO|nr:uncharacterized protein N7532_001183 [Penicillium argentinense]KAJ5110648.1 hypothetical protein N7532_001183 [Penicillium argentinense]